MFNKTFALILLATGVAHAQGQVDMTGDSSTPPATPPPASAVPVAGVNSSGAPFTKGTLGVSFQMTLLSNITTVASLTSERVPKIDLLYFLSATAAVDLIAGFNFHKTQVYNNATPPMPVDRSYTGFAAGAGYRMYKHRDHVATYIEPELVLEWGDVSNSANLTVNALGLFGVEAMLATWCSLSGSVGGGLAAGNKFKDIQIATSANLAANLYWK